jgi:inorganic phosphate transporter, PiT family
MSSELILCFAVIVVALAFTYTNGFHDTANAIATVVGTKVLTPRQAIALAAVTNLIGAFFGLAVAKTISSGLVDSAFVTQGVLLATLLSAIAWNLLTWWFGLPSSSTHALVGSLCGAVLAAASGNFAALKWIELKEKIKTSFVEPPPEVLAAVQGPIEDGTTFVTIGETTHKLVAFGDRVMLAVESTTIEKAGILYKVVIPMVASPLFGFVAGFLVMSLLYFVLKRWRPVTVNRVFGKLQLLSSAYMGFSHGMNDATKSMGLVTLALVAATKAGLFVGLPAWLGWLATNEGSDPHKLSLGDTLMSWLPSFLQFGYMPALADPTSQGVPDWVVVVCALTMAAGTAAGGWRIIKTLGHKMVKLQPVHGFAAETTAATVLAAAGTLGMPVSTTHAITTSIMGVGCAKRFSALKLKVIERILWAWVLTIPATAGLAFALVWLGKQAGWMG